MSVFQREALFPGIHFNHISDTRFKSNRLSVHFLMPLEQSMASVHALIPYLLRKSCRNYPDFLALNQYLYELYGSYVDFDVDKYGDRQVVSCAICGIDDRFTLQQEPMTKTLTELLLQMLLEPVLEDGLFPKKEVELEKETLLDNIRSLLNDKRSYALHRSVELMCENEPYGIDKYGTIEDVKAITPQSCTEAYCNLLQKAEVEILFVGRGNAEEVKTLCKDAFAKLSRTPMSVPESTMHVPAAEKREVTERLDVAQSKLVLGFSCPGKRHSVEESAARLMVTVLGGTPMSKLFVHVREEKSLCYYCAARWDPNKRIILIDCGVENDTIEQAKEAILEQLTLLQQGQISEEELSFAWKHLKNMYQTIPDTQNGLAGYYLGRILSGRILTPEQQLEELSRVTREQIIEAANRVTPDLFYCLTGKAQ